MDCTAFVEIQAGPYAAVCRRLEPGDVVTVGRSGRCSWALPDVRSLMAAEATLCWDGVRLQVYQSSESFLRRPAVEGPAWSVEPGRVFRVGDVALGLSTAAHPMSPASPLERLRAYLGSRKQNVYLIVDAAADPGVRAWLDTQPFRFESLFQGQKQATYGRQAPYLVQADCASGWMSPVLRYLWGRSMLTILLDDREMDAVRKHLRHFLLVRHPKGKTVYFRYYDPRILHAFFASADDAQCRAFFGPGSVWLAEKTRPSQFTEFSMEEGGGLGVRSGVLGGEVQ